MLGIHFQPALTFFRKPTVMHCVQSPCRPSRSHNIVTAPKVNKFHYSGNFAQTEFTQSAQREYDEHHIAAECHATSRTLKDRAPRLLGQFGSRLAYTVCFLLRPLAFLAQQSAHTRNIALQIL